MLSVTDVLNTLTVGVIILDQDLRISHWNTWLSQRSRISVEMAEQRLLVELLPELQGSRLLAACEQAVNSKLSSLLSSTLHRSPLPLYALDASVEMSGQHPRLEQAITIRALAHGSGQSGCLVEIHDTTATNKKEQLLKQQALTLSWQATHDPLTLLGNRAHLMNHLARLLQSAKQQAQQHVILMFDLDRFKPINDCYGHAAGDEILKQVGDIFRSLLRTDDIAVRMGGDEFAILLPHCVREAGELTCRQLCAAIEQQNFRFGEQVLRVGVSAGVHQIDTDSQSATEVLRLVDETLYRTKRERSGAGGDTEAIAINKM